MDSSQSRSQSNPAGFKNILNNDEPPAQRDSGFYSTDIPSKHTSAASIQPIHGLSPAASGGYQSSADKTPSPSIAPHPGHHMVSPSSASASNPRYSASGYDTPNHYDQRRLQHQPSVESNHSNSTIGESMGPGAASRRESVDSRMQQGFSNMALGAPTSPYATNNHSSTSISSQLHSQRNPRPGLEAHPVQQQRISNGYAPGNERNPDPKAIRTAPAITGPVTGNVARAAEPTKGQPWAFPEDEPPAQAPGVPYDASRRSSITDSIASSQFTGDSRLPPGQRRLEDGPSPPGGHMGAGDYPVHSHVLHHRQLDDYDAATGAQPYSRTPELRVSHKLAERKRRTEMKELFDALRDEMPQERGSKASKWEILTKAINEHRLQKEHIKNLSAKNQHLEQQLRSCRCHGERPIQPPPPPQAQQQPRHPLPPQASQQIPYGNGSYTQAEHEISRDLPPIRTLGPESMTGVQYEAPSNGNGYRPDRY